MYARVFVSASAVSAGGAPAALRAVGPRVRARPNTRLRYYQRPVPTRSNSYIRYSNNIGYDYRPVGPQSQPYYINAAYNRH